MQRIKLYLYLLVFAPVFWAQVACATDFTRFLSYTGPLKPAGPGVVVDDTGAEYRYDVLSPQWAYSAVGASIFTEATGLPNLPVYPILHKQEDGTYVPATLTPVAYTFPDFKPEKMNGKQLGEFAAQLVVNYVLGAYDSHRKATPESVYFFNTGHAANYAQGWALGGFTVAEPPGLADYLKQLPAHAKELTGSDRTDFARALDRLLNKMEKMGNKRDIEKALGPAFEAENRLRTARGEPPFDYEKAVLSRINGARKELMGYLSKEKFPDSVVSDIKPGWFSSAAVEPHINLPATRLDADTAPTLSRKHAPVDLLWGHFFAQDKAKRDEAIKGLAAQLRVSPSEVVAKLTKLAADDQSRIYEVLPHMQPSTTSFSSDDLPQTTLNPRNDTTLVVVPVNDDEAREIEKISKKAGAHVLAIHAPHGAKLDSSRTYEIESYVKKHGITRVIVVELPGSSLDREEAIRKTGAELVIVDHHDYKDLDRHHPLSSLEQTAIHLGWKLSPESKAIGVMDRSLIFGLADLGVPREGIQRFINKSSGYYSYGSSSYGGSSGESLGKLRTNKGIIYLSRGHYGALKELVMPLAERQYPVIPNVLNFRYSSIGFSGSPDIVQKLQEIVKPYESQLGTSGAHFSGGDKARSMFWGLKDIPESLMPEITHKIAKYFQEELMKPLPPGAEIDPHYPPSEFPPDYRPPFLVLGIPTRDLGEILELDHKERLDVLDDIRWSLLDDAQKKKLIEVSEKITDSSEMSAMSRIANTAYSEKAWDPFRKRYEESRPKPVYVPPPAWTSGSGSSALYQSYYDSRVYGYQPGPTIEINPEPPKPPPVAKDPPPGSGLAEKREAMREELAKAAKGAPLEYIEVLNKYLPGVKVPWDFLELTTKGVRSSTFELESLTDEWVENHLEDFFKLEPSVMEMRRAAEASVFAPRLFIKILENGIQKIKTAEEYLALFDGPKKLIPSDREDMTDKLIEQTPGVFFATKPTAKQIGRLANMYRGAKPKLMAALLSHTESASEFLFVVDSKSEWGMTFFGRNEMNDAIARVADHFLKFEPTIEARRTLLQKLDSEDAKNRYSKAFFQAATSADEFVALARSEASHAWNAEEMRRAESIGRSLWRFFELKPSCAAITVLFHAAAPDDSVQLAIMERGLENVHTLSDFFVLASLKESLRDPQARWKAARLIANLESWVRKQVPSVHEWQLFERYTSQQGTEAPPPLERCLDWFKGTVRKLGGR